MASHFPPADDSIPDFENLRSIYLLTEECHNLFQKLLAEIRHSDLEFDAVETQYGRLNLWASNIGALADGNSSLDYRLRSSPDIKSMLIQLLEILSRNLHRAIEIQNESYDSVSTGLGSIYAEAIDSSSASLDRLQTLAVIIRKSSAHSRNIRSQAFSDESELHFKQFVITILRHRFKQANGSLCEQLAESIAQRRKKFDYQMRHQRKLAQNATKIMPTKERTVLETEHHLEISRTDHERRNPAGQIQLQPHDHPRLETLSADAPSQTNASTLDSKVFRKLFREYKPAPSIVSTGTSVQDLELEYPPPPAGSAWRGGCTCPYCCEILLPVRLSDEKWWQRHVDADLEPYSCISEKCRSSPLQFVKFHDWVQHMDTHGPSNMAWNIHLQMFHCPICELIEPFRWKEELMSHMDSYHAERFTPVQLLTLSRRSTTAVLREAHICPLCNCMPDEIKKISPDNRNKISELLPKHIAGHLKSLTFMALPYRDDVNDYESDTVLDRSLGKSSALSRRFSDVSQETQSSSSLEIEALLSPNNLILADPLSPDNVQLEDPWIPDDVQLGDPWNPDNLLLEDPWSPEHILPEEFDNLGNLGVEYTMSIPDIETKHSELSRFWDFLPTKDYGAEEDAVLLHLMSRQGKINTAQSLPIPQSLKEYEDQIIPRDSDTKPLQENQASDSNPVNVYYTSLEEYEVIVGKIKAKDLVSQRLVVQTFSWLICAKRSLYLSELRDAVVCPTKIGQDPLNTALIPGHNEVSSVCGEFIVVDENEIVSLSSTVIERYFEDTFEAHWGHLGILGPRTVVAQVCLIYLTYTTFARGPCATYQEMRARNKRYPLYFYVAENWGHHLRQIGEAAQREIYVMADWTPRRISSTVQAMMSTEEGDGQDFPKHMTEYHLLAYFDLDIALKSHHQSSGSSNSLDRKDSDDRTPLIWASIKNSTNVMRVLLSMSVPNQKFGPALILYMANLNAQDRNGRTALSWAAGNGHMEAVLLLLQRGADKSICDRRGRTAGIWAALNGHIKMAEVVLGVPQITLMYFT